MRSCLTCILGLIFFTSLHAQSTKDSRFNDLIARAKAIRDSLPKEAKVQYLRAWKIDENQGAEKKAWLLNEIGFLYHLESNYDSSLLFYRQGLATSIAASHAEEEVGAYQGLANNFLSLSV